MLSLSTSWNGPDTDDGHKIVAEAKELGFDLLELNYSLKITTLREILAEKNDGSITISSLHNYCPAVQSLKFGKPQLEPYSLCALESQERQSAIKHSLKTIEFAELFQAPAVVLHGGWIEMENLENVLREMYRDNMQGTPKYQKLKGEYLKKREKKSGHHLEGLCRTLEVLNQEATRRKIKLGIENRYSYTDVPNFDEIGTILKKFDGSSIFYWHDVGHAQVQEELGFTKHLDLLETYKNKMIGVHLHDVEGIDDHRVPLLGKFDFEKIKPYLCPDTIKVMELVVKAPRQEVARGLNYIRSLFEE